MPAQAPAAGKQDAASGPEEAVRRFYEKSASLDDPALFISVLSPEEAMARARRAPADMPLSGTVFAVKDNIDVAGLPTTAACPAFAYRPAASATVVRRLEQAGAVAVAKLNMDQFATGLVGTRSPFGTPVNPLAPERAPGGSSSGSAVAVARGLVSFALGTDTAGSGRVPAMFTGTVGLKPTRGWLSNTGVVAAVRSLDCVSVHAADVDLAWRAAVAAASYDRADPFSRVPPGPRPASLPGHRWAEDGPAARVGFASASGVPESLLALVGEPSPVDLTPFFEAGSMLYEGPWLAERFAAVGEFILAHRAEVDPVVAEVVLGGDRWSAVDFARAMHRLAELRREVAAVFEEIDVLVVPTAPFHPTLAEVAADPIGVNARLGLYTTFVNPLDMCAVAVPTRGLEGLTVVAPAWQDALAASVASALAASAGGES